MRFSKSFFFCYIENLILKLYLFILFHRINNELNGWFERHVKVNNRNRQPNQENLSTTWPGLNKEKASVKLNHLNLKSGDSKDQISSASKFKIHQNRRQLRIERATEKNSNPKTQDYPVSLYNTQSILYENFARTIRKRNDTFYYISLRKVKYYLFKRKKLLNIQISVF